MDAILELLHGGPMVLRNAKRQNVKEIQAEERIFLIGLDYYYLILFSEYPSLLEEGKLPLTYKSFSHQTPLSEIDIKQRKTCGFTLSTPGICHFTIYLIPIYLIPIYF